MTTFGSIEQAIQDLRNGKIIIVADDEDRENEGDLVCAAELATPEMINFMTLHGRGLICLPMAGEIVKAFVALKAGFAPSDELRRELLGHGRLRLGAAVAPKEIDFRANLPKTRSGKIMRRLLKARELGLPEGDLSTLESDER